MEELSPGNGVEVAGVSKRFLLNTEPVGRVSSWFFHSLIARSNRRELWALRDVSFNIRRGELLGILGVNGSGKSTLLRLICGISESTEGVIRRLPKIAPLLDLTAGFHPSLTGYENIFLNGSLIGLHREEIRRLLPEIVSFSGLDHKFLEAPVRTYSTGMMARLGFALAVAVDPDIILIDEVLAVGDLEFQAKSAHKLLEFRDQGKAMALVSHASAAIGELSSEAIWLHEGRLRSEGAAPGVVAEYNAYLTERMRRGIVDGIAGVNRSARENVDSSGQLKISIRLQNGSGKPAEVFETNAALVAEVEIRLVFNTPNLADPIDLRVDAMFQTGVIVDEFMTSERGLEPFAISELRKPLVLTIRFDPLLLLRGDYWLTVAAISGEQIVGLSERIPFQVESDYVNFGVYPAFVAAEFS